MSKILVNSNTFGKLGAMTEKKLWKVEKARQVFEQNNIIYIETINGQMVIDGIQFWSTTESWYNPRTCERGKGINSFLNHLELQGLKF